MKEGLAVTADGQIFRGWSVGAEGVGQGEVIFNTSMGDFEAEIYVDKMPITGIFTRPLPVRARTNK